MYTRDDVAKRAGVSPAVVSYVLNNSNYVSEKKRQSVLKAIKELNYYPNATARSLKIGKSKEFLLVSDDIRNEMFSEITYYMEPVAYEKGYTLTVLSSAQKNYDDLLDSFSRKNYAGIFIFSGVIPFTKEYVDRLNSLAEQGTPIVLFMFIHNETEFNSNITVLRTNIKQAVCSAVDYLADVKHHSIIGYLGDGDPIASGESIPFGDGLRINGYIDSLKKHGIEPKTEYVFFMDQFKNSKTFLNVEGMIEKFMQMPKPERPTAFFVNSDPLAAILMKRFKELGFSVPDDIEIIGFGNTHSANIVTPQITSVDMPCERIGLCAINILLAKANHMDFENEFFELKLVRRGSA